MPQFLVKAKTGLEVASAGAGTKGLGRARGPGKADCQGVVKSLGRDGVTDAEFWGEGQRPGLEGVIEFKGCVQIWVQARIGTTVLPNARAET